MLLLKSLAFTPSHLQFPMLLHGQGDEGWTFPGNVQRSILSSMIRGYLLCSYKQQMSETIIFPCFLNILSAVNNYCVYQLWQYFFQMVYFHSWWGFNLLKKWFYSSVKVLSTNLLSLTTGVSLKMEPALKNKIKTISTLHYILKNL